MSLNSAHSWGTFSKSNRHMILLLIVTHLLWSWTVFGLWSAGHFFESPGPWAAVSFIGLQLYAAAQLLLPALRLHPEERNRGFYIFWGMTFALSIWSINQVSYNEDWLPLLTATKSALLLLVATLIGAALARYVNRLWEIVPVCIVMTLADFVSWVNGPTAGFVQQIKSYYLAPQGPPPLIDMILIKLVFPGKVGFAPLFGISDWIMVVFFAIVARRYGVNDNLFGASGETLAKQGRLGCYLPVSVVALFSATVLAQASGLFIPALPLIALIMLVWYGTRYLLSCRA